MASTKSFSTKRNGTDFTTRVIRVEEHMAYRLKDRMLVALCL